jgi:rubrerythrin
MRFRHPLTAVLAAGIAAVLASVAVTSAASPSTAASPPVAALPSSTMSSVTQGLLISAAKTEADAFMQYATYADAAAGHPKLANVWRTVGEVEHQDHWTHEVTLANLYSGSDNIGNLKAAIAQAQQTANADSILAAKAPKRSTAAGQLKTVARREGADARLLARALAALQGQVGMPAAPAVKTLPIRVVPKPRYSGTFYNALTGDSNSALEMAAWNWSEYQFLAKTAVDTGQANLAAVFAALEAQERYQNWAGLSNAAGYANANATNLKVSIASEQGAIDMYGQYAAQAQRAGDSSLASVFRSIRGDELGHHQTFTTELRQLTRRK